LNISIKRPCLSAKSCRLSWWESIKYPLRSIQISYRSNIIMKRCFCSYYFDKPCSRLFKSMKTRQGLSYLYNNCFNSFPFSYSYVGKWTYCSGFIIFLNERLNYFSWRGEIEEYSFRYLFMNWAVFLVYIFGWSLIRSFAIKDWGTLKLLECLKFYISLINSSSAFE